MLRAKAIFPFFKPRPRVSFTRQQNTYDQKITCLAQAGSHVLSKKASNFWPSNFPSSSGLCLYIWGSYPSRLGFSHRAACSALLPLGVGVYVLPPATPPPPFPCSIFPSRQYIAVCLNDGGWTWSHLVCWGASRRTHTPPSCLSNACRGTRRKQGTKHSLAGQFFFALASLATLMHAYQSCLECACGA